MPGAAKSAGQPQPWLVRKSILSTAIRREARVRTAAALLILQESHLAMAVALPQPECISKLSQAATEPSPPATFLSPVSSNRSASVSLLYHLSAIQFPVPEHPCWFNGSRRLQLNHELFQQHHQNVHPYRREVRRLRLHLPCARRRCLRCSWPPPGV